MNRLLRVSLLACTLALAACGFHLRQSAALPASMQRMHLAVNGGGDLQRDLARALEDSGVTIEEEGGPGIAELKIPLASFNTETLSVSGGARVTEYTVRYQVRFEVDGGDGQALVPRQRIDMSRDFSYDATNTIGTEAQVEEIRRSLNDDMVQAILFRLQAAGRNMPAGPAAASAG
ncbi:LPS assembly lipoprotein LptE [Frateuria hangzhouensis]|uniref:LPS-assembly lipoprotein LptE n=1 Tax=Frateuria hangzhouensis TaxID=2995589 RepID=UPI002260D412|nr:LPS assembly lipoprotein LptE [Frateuria sp. STR12]MCX7515389.1 LPS assembly lipoprotein LptE [Frateuria sp. STR12]